MRSYWLTTSRTQLLVNGYSGVMLIAIVIQLWFLDCNQDAENWWGTKIENCLFVPTYLIEIEVTLQIWWIALKLTSLSKIQKLKKGSKVTEQPFQCYTHINKCTNKLLDPAYPNISCNLFQYLTYVTWKETKSIWWHSNKQLNEAASD